MANSSDGFDPLSKPPYTNGTMVHEATLGDGRNAIEQAMTLAVCGEWLAVRLDQLERFVTPERLWPVPLARPQHAGLLDLGNELVPVFELGPRNTRRSTPLLVAVLVASGARFGLLAERAGQIARGFAFDEAGAAPTPCAAALSARAASAGANRFWLFDALALRRVVAPEPLAPEPASPEPASPEPQAA